MRTFKLTHSCYLTFIKILWSGKQPRLTSFAISFVKSNLLPGLLWPSYFSSPWLAAVGVRFDGDSDLIKIAMNVSVPLFLLWSKTAASFYFWDLFYISITYQCIGNHIGRYDKFDHAHITRRNFVFIKGNDKFAIIVNIETLIFPDRINV